MPKCYCPQCKEHPKYKLPKSTLVMGTQMSPPLFHTCNKMSLRMRSLRDLLGSPVVDSVLLLQETPVQSLVGKTKIPHAMGHGKRERKRGLKNLSTQLINDKND